MLINFFYALRAAKLKVSVKEYLTLLEGLKEGDQVVTGPFQSVRGMRDGDAVTITTAAAASAATKS